MSPLTITFGISFTVNVALFDSVFVQPLASVSDVKVYVVVVFGEIIIGPPVVRLPEPSILVFNVDPPAK